MRLWVVKVCNKSFFGVAFYDHVVSILNLKWQIHTYIPHKKDNIQKFHITEP